MAPLGDRGSGLELSLTFFSTSKNLSLLLQCWLLCWKWRLFSWTLGGAFIENPRVQMHPAYGHGHQTGLTRRLMCDRLSFLLHPLLRGAQMMPLNSEIEDLSLASRCR